MSTDRHESTDSDEFTNDGLACGGRCGRASETEEENMAGSDASVQGRAGDDSDGPGEDPRAESQNDVAAPLQFDPKTNR